MPKRELTFHNIEPVVVFAKAIDIVVLQSNIQAYEQLAVLARAILEVFAKALTCELARPLLENSCCNFKGPFFDFGLIEADLLGNSYRCCLPPVAGDFVMGGVSAVEDCRLFLRGTALVDLDKPNRGSFGVLTFRVYVFGIAMAGNGELAKLVRASSENLAVEVDLEVVKHDLVSFFGILQTLDRTVNSGAFDLAFFEVLAQLVPGHIFKRHFHIFFKVKHFLLQE